MSEIVMKPCSSLSECKHPEGPWLPHTREYFYASKQGVRGLMAKCKACCKERTKRWAATRTPLKISDPRKYRARMQKANKQRREKHPDASRIYSQRRRAREAKLLSTFTSEDRAIMLDYWQHRCCVCGRTEDENYSLTEDHWIPVVKRGPYTADNIVPLCASRRGANCLEPSCNFSKHAKDPVQWLTEKYDEERAKVISDHVQAYFKWVRKE